jgi:endoglucanase
MEGGLPDFPLERGVNISHWLSQSDRRGEARRSWFTERDVAGLAEKGFDHLRIPVDEEQMWDEQGRPEAEAFGLLNQVLDWCAARKMRVIVDLHILRSHHFNNKERPLWTKPEAKERFLQCWRDLSSALGRRPVEWVAYELLNEPVAEDPEEWNKLVARAHAVIRDKEPGRLLVIGSNFYQSVDTFDRLQVPGGDPRILLSFHFYEPFRMTHHQASWVSFGAYKGPVTYPGLTVREEDLAGLPEDLARDMREGNGSWDRARIRQQLAKPLALARQTGLPLYCGEFGCLPAAPREARLAWYRDVVSVLEEAGVARSAWDYKGGFGVLGGGIWDDELVAILAGTGSLRRR